jgi:hypothetical protein
MIAGTVRPSITRSLPSPTGAFAPWIFRVAGLSGALIVLLAAASPSVAPEITVARLGHFTENRGWNEAGLSPSYQVVVTATVVPSAHPTIVFAEQNGVRKALTHLPYPSAPDLYAYWQRFEPALSGAWRVVAERGEARSMPAWTPVLARPRPVPLLPSVRVTRSGPDTRVSWELPDLVGFDIDRIRVAVRGGKRLYERFLGVLYVSSDLPPTATAFVIPPAVLAAGERYVFEVMLEDLEGGELQNRSLTYSEPYTVPR